MEKIVVPDDFPSIFSGTEALRRLQQVAHVSVYTERASSEEALIQRLQGARIAVNIRAYSKFSETLLRACPDLKMIAVLGIGTDHIDLAAAFQLGIQVSNTPGYSAVSVAGIRSPSCWLQPGKYASMKETCGRAIGAGCP